MPTSNYFLALCPELILTVVASIGLLLGLSRREDVRRAVPVFSLLAILVALGVLAAPAILLALEADYQLIPAPGLGRAILAGIDIGHLATYTRLIALAVGAIILLVNWHLPAAHERGEFFAMVLLSIVGLMLVAAADDLVVFLLALELVSVPTYILVATSSQDIRAQEAAGKYFFLGAMSVALMVYGFSFLYGVSGTTAMTGGLAAYLTTQGTSNPFAIIGLLLAFAGLAFKMAAVPFHFYAPDVYQGAASPVTGLLGFLPKAAGFVGLTKLLALTGWQLPDSQFWALWVLAALTMTVGNVLALLQRNVKRMLAYSSIAHSGYMLIGLLVGPVAGEGPMRDGVAAMLFYIAAYGVMNLGAFAVLAYLTIRDRPVEELDDLAGVSRREPTAALVMAVCVFSLMGMPPTAGFLAKVYVFSAAFSLSAEHEHRLALIVLAVIGVVNSAIAAAYYLRILGACYLREPIQTVKPVACGALRMGLALCTAIVIGIGVWPKHVVLLSNYATQDVRPSRLLEPPPSHAEAAAENRAPPPEHE